VTLWKQAVTVHKLIARIEVGKSTRELGELRKQCEALQSRLYIEKDYEAMFPADKRTGQEFFNMVCNWIRKGDGLCFAVDRADKKEESSWVEVWKRPPYLEFKDASIEAARQPGTTFRRLFILEAKAPPADRERITEFVEELVKNQMEIGFLLRDHINLGELTERYETDFIVVGYKDATADGYKNALGFELRNEEFVVRELSWKRNLTAKQRLNSKYILFDQLWKQAVIIPHAKQETIGYAINQIIEES
jgi:hypothetical protein